MRTYSQSKPDWRQHGTSGKGPWFILLTSYEDRLHQGWSLHHSRFAALAVTPKAPAPRVSF